jgi:hypothetical protein
VQAPYIPPHREGVLYRYFTMEARKQVPILSASKIFPASLEIHQIDVLDTFSLLKQRVSCSCIFGFDRKKYGHEEAASCP